MTQRKCRTWWFVQRIDNLPDDWREQLSGLLVPGCYIVHDKDTAIDDATGEEVPKAPHVHVMLSFNSQILASTVLDALPDSFGVRYAKPVPNRVGGYRYLMHLGSPDKHQYDRSEIVHMHGFSVNLSEVYGVDFTDVYQLVNELQIDNFAVLMSYLVEFKPDFVPYVQSHVNLVRTYMLERAKLL